MYIRFDPRHRIAFELGEVEFDFTNPNICHGKGSGGGGTETVNNSTAPPPQVMAAYQTALTAAQSAASQPLQQYNAPTVAGFAPDQLSAFGQVANAQGIANPYINASQQAIQAGTAPLWSSVQQFSPSTINQYQSPYTSSVLNATMAAENNQDQQQQAALQGNAISSGAWGGDRAGVASSILSGQQDIANNQTNANIMNQGYNTALGEFNTQQQSQLGANEANDYLQQQAAFGLAGLGTEAQNTALTGANAQEASGAIQQQLAQSQLNIPYEQFLQSQAYPFQTAQYFSNIAEGIGSQSGGTGTSATTTPAPSIGSQIAGFGLGGLGIAGAALSNRGGRIGGFRRGGMIRPRGFASGGVPDLSVDFIPNSQSPIGRGPPQAQSSSETRSAPSQSSSPSASDLASVGKGVKALYNYFSASPTGGAITNALDPGASELSGISNPLDTYDLASNPSGGFGLDAATSGLDGGAADVGSAATSSLADISNPLDMLNLAGTDSLGAGLDLAGTSGLEGLTGTGLGDAASALIPDLGSEFAGSALGADAASAAATDLSFSDVFDAIASIFAFKKGGAVKGMGARSGHKGMGRHYDVGGATPMQASMQGQTQPTQASELNSMTPQQLQAMMMRLPIGSQQQKTVQSILNQKRMMPNTGAQVSNGVPQGQQPQAQPQQGQQQAGLYGGLARGGKARRSFGGEDPGGIVLPYPAPSDPSEIAQRAAELGDLPGVAADGADVQRVPLSDLAPPQGRESRVGAGPPQPLSAPENVAATASPPPAASSAGKKPVEYEKDAPDTGSDYSSEEPPNSRAPAKANPWLALAQAGFAMAGGTSPYAGVNIGRGAQAGIENYTNQQKEADTVNEAADKLMTEAKQHKDSIAQEQARTDEEVRHNKTIEGQGKYTVSRDPITGQVQLIDTKTGDVKQGSSAFDTTGVAGAPTGGGAAPTAAGQSGNAAPAVPVSVMNAYKQPMGDDGKPLTGEKYLATLPPQVANMTKQFGNLQEDVSPYMLTRGDPITKAAIAAVPYYKPGWTAASFKNLQRYNFDPNGGVKEKALDTVVPHTQMLRDLTQAMQTGDQRTVNDLQNRFQTEYGLSAAPTNLQSAAQLVGSEIVNSSIAQGGKGSALGDREEVAKNIDATLSPKLLQANLDKVYLPALRAQANATGNHYKNSTGLSDFQGRLLPETQRALWGTLYPGTVYKGMKYTGGDIKDQNNWQPVQQGQP